MPDTFYTNVSKINSLVTDIYDTEQTRLTNRQKSINDMMTSQKRLISLNQSYTSKMKKYGYLVSMVAFALVIVVMIIHFRNLMPSILADLIIIGVIAGAIIWSYLIYVDIQNRDKIDFDELAVDSSALVNPANIDTANTNAGNAGDVSALAANANLGTGCVGRTCCPTDWNDSTSILAPGSIYFNTNINKCKVRTANDTQQPNS